MGLHMACGTEVASIITRHFLVPSHFSMGKGRNPPQARFTEQLVVTLEYGT